MFTSRADTASLRGEDNADLRLTGRAGRSGWSTTRAGRPSTESAMPSPPSSSA